MGEKTLQELIEELANVARPKFRRAAKAVSLTNDIVLECGPEINAVAKKLAENGVESVPDGQKEIVKGVLKSLFNESIVESMAVAQACK